MKSSEVLAGLDFKITEVDLSGVARNDPPQNPINFTEMDLSSQQVNNALELTLVQRVQLECNADEMEGKSTEAIAKLDLSFQRLSIAEESVVDH